VLAARTPAQTWQQGQYLYFALSSSVFTDPQHEALTYTASGAGASSLPTWLVFNPATRAFTGTVPAGMEQFSVVVTAMNTAGLSTSETFSVSVAAAAPAVAHLTPSQGWVEGGVVSLVLATDTFTDPQGEAMTFKVTQADGAALPGWLQFNAATLAFSGTAPSTAQVLGLKVTATDTSNLSVYEMFSATIAPGAVGLVAGDWWGEAAGFGNSPMIAAVGQDGRHLGAFAFEVHTPPMLLPITYHHA